MCIRDRHIPAEVVGFNEHKVLLMPYTDLEGIGPGSIVDNTGDKLNVRVGDKLIGRIIDALGNPLDDGEPIEYTDTVDVYKRQVGSFRFFLIIFSLV